MPLLAPRTLDTLDLVLEESLDGGVLLPLEPAERVWVGKYELLHRLGAGGMAEVFLARTIAVAGFEKLVALKRVRPEWAENERLIEMLLQEARLAATLHHPNVVQIYDAGEDGENVFFTMEYVAGKDLRRLVQASVRQRQRLPLGHVLHIIIGCAAGLHYAHEHRSPEGVALEIVHRDVSPSNILVSYDGTAKIVDFGIARAANDPTLESGEALRGKIPYMSPEQCRGQELDRRSDVFSLGILLWELTVGRRLFTNLKGQDVELARHIAKNPAPAPSSVHPEYPPELEAIVVKALALDPAERYQSALELQLDLEEFARERRLVTSQARLAETMRQLFASEIEAEEEAVRGYLSLNQPTPPPPPRAPTRAYASIEAEVLPPSLIAEAERPLWQRFAPIGLAVVLLVLAAAAIVQSGTSSISTAPPKTATPDPGRSGAWEDDSPILSNNPTPAPPVAREIVVSSPTTKTPARVDDPVDDDGDPATKRPTAKTKKKTKQKPPENWDPNSPLPPS